MVQLQIAYMLKIFENIIVICVLKINEVDRFHQFDKVNILRGTNKNCFQMDSFNYDIWFYYTRLASKIVVR